MVAEVVVSLNIEEIHCMLLTNCNGSKTMRILVLGAWHGHDLQLLQYIGGSSTVKYFGCLAATACLISFDLLQVVHVMVMPPTVNDKYSTHECPYLSLEDKAIFLVGCSDRTLASGLSPITKLNGIVRKRGERRGSFR